MTLSVYLPRQWESDVIAYLRDNLRPEVKLLGPNLPTDPDYHILVAGRPKREHFTASPNLQAIIVPWAGLPRETRDLARDFPHVSVHNLHHNAAPTAEMAMALLLAAAKSLVPIDRTLREHDWTPRYEPAPVWLMDGKTVLILGYGAVGRRVARACRGLGMDVLATKRHVRASYEGPDEIHPPEALHDLLPRADALIICLPYTSETAGLIGQAELSLLPPSAVLVNIGRGPIVDEAALYHALRDGEIYAAGLDVWYNYPEDKASRSHTPPSDYSFHELDNVVMSPHRAGAGGDDEVERRRMKRLAELLNAAARGEAMPNQVDLETGY